MGYIWNCFICDLPNGGADYQPFLRKGKMPIKYLIVETLGMEQVVLFSPMVSHKNAALGLYVISAGFYKDGKCYGLSESLNISSRPEQDIILVNELFELMKIKRGTE